MILSEAGEVAAVVDWELCTLGDPLADVGMLIVYWSEAGDELMPLFEAPTTAAGFPVARRGPRALRASAPDATSRRSTSTSRSAWWKLAIILQGVYARYAAGQYGKPDEGIEQFAKIVEQLAQGGRRGRAPPRLRCLGLRRLG